MLNKEILELRNLRKSQKFPALNKKEVFIREMFMVKNTRVVVAEYFETNSKQSPIWLFALRKDKKDLEHWISLDICKVTSIDLKTMKELEGNKVVYHLHKNYRSQKGEMLYIFYKKPSYNEVKKELINILN